VVLFLHYNIHHHAALAAPTVEAAHCLIKLDRLSRWPSLTKLICPFGARAAASLTGDMENHIRPHRLFDRLDRPTIPFAAHWLSFLLWPIRVKMCLLMIVSTLEWHEATA
jgi:hypothetical protein